MLADHISIYKSVANFYRMLRLDRKDISSIYILALLAGLVQLSLPLGVQTIIGFVMAGSVSTSIIVLIIMVVLGTFFNGLLQIRQLQIIEKVKQKIFLRYSFEFSDRLPKLNIEALDNAYLPELVNRFFDTVSLQKGFEKLLLDIPASVIQVLLGLLLLSFYHPIFIGFGALLLLIVLLILKYTFTKGFASALDASDYKYKIAAWLQEIARGVKSFKYSKGTSLHLAKTDQLVSGYLDSRTNYFKVLLSQFWSLISFKVIITAAMLMVGSFLLVGQQINIGQFIAADIVIIAIIGSIEKLIVSLDKVYDALVSMVKLGKITEAEIEGSGKLVLQQPNQGVAVQFNEVNFSYPNGDCALKNISFVVRPGQIVYITGASGSGKSSILRLLTGAFKEFTGNILIDGIPIGNYDLQLLRSQTGILLNSQDIFQGTLLENLTMGDSSIDLQEITELAEKTELTKFIQANKEGFDTLLDPVGKRLPQYIKQNILLIRALLGKHRLLLLEEPFSHLRSTSKDAILQMIKTNKNVTVFITSQEPYTAEEYDLVLHLEGNKLVQH